jgi:hypothetical protein
MPFSPVDVPIQEMLQSDFIVDLAQIHNTNVLLLKDKLEDVINTLEIDVSTISIGVDSPINNIRTQNVIIQDGGWKLQTGVPNQIIAKLEKNGSNQSVLNVDILNIDISADFEAIDVNSLVVNTSVAVAGDSSFTGSLSYTGQLVESKEAISSTLLFDGVDTAEARVTLTNTSKTNIYVKLEAETAVGATQVWNGASFAAGLTSFILYLDFDATNPPAPNTSFTIYIVDVIENSGATSLATNINTATLPITVAPGLNLNTGSSQILLHNDFDSLSLKLGINPASADPLSSALSKYGSNATFNYIIDETSDDRLMITSTVGMEVFS